MSGLVRVLWCDWKGDRQTEIVSGSLQDCLAAWSVIWFRVQLPGPQRTEAKQAPLMIPHGQPTGSGFGVVLCLDAVWGDRPSSRCEMLEKRLESRSPGLGLGLGPWYTRCSIVPENIEQVLQTVHWVLDGWLDYLRFLFFFLHDYRWDYLRLKMEKVFFFFFAFLLDE